MILSTNAYDSFKRYNASYCTNVFLIDIKYNMCVCVHINNCPYSIKLTSKRKKKFIRIKLAFSTNPVKCMTN